MNNILSSFKSLFVSPSTVYPDVSATTTDEVDEDVDADDCLLSICEQLNGEQITSIFPALDEADSVLVFLQLSDDKQNHVFPLLEANIQEQIMMKLNSQDQARLQHELQCYSQRMNAFSKHPNDPENIFFHLNTLNALKHYYPNKRIYFVNIHDLHMIDIKPYKYQRKLMQRHVQTIADGIRTSKIMYHPIILGYNEPKNQLTILDGQHRFKAIKLLVGDDSFTDDVYVQLDVIEFNDDDDTQIMQMYQNINTNIPIDASKLHMELSYVHLVQIIKGHFSFQNVRSFEKDIETQAQHFVIDSCLKEELQYRNVLLEHTSMDVLECLKQINEDMSKDHQLLFDLPLIDSKICQRNRFYLGVQWPYAINKLEQYLKKCK